MKTKAEFKKNITETIGSGNIQLLKRTYKVLLLLCFSYMNVAGQTNFAWAKKVGYPQGDYFSKIAVDSDGNSYVTGMIYPGGIWPENQFVAKFNSSGIQQWISPSVGFEGRDICVDGSGNSYVTGYNNEGGYFNDTTKGHILLVKLSPTGGILWVKKIGKMSEDSQGRGVSVDVLGNVYISADNGLIAKYNTSGVLQWMQKINSSSINAIDVDASGNAIVAGHFSANVTIGSFNLNAPAGDNVFIAKVSPAGVWLWAIRANEYGHPRGLDVDGSNNIFITGENEASQLSHIFLSKYNASGVFQWSQTAEARYLIGSDVSVDNFNNVYITGGFGGNLYIGNANVLNLNEYSTTLTSLGSTDIYFAKYGTDGVFKWAQNAGGTGGDSGNGIANDVIGNIYLSGSFSSSIAFANITLTSAGSLDGFIVKILADNIIVNNQKVTICHKGKTINVSQNAVAAHLAHGDKLGICTTSKILTVYMDSSLVVDETSLALYPNPSSGLISYEICKNNVREEAKIEIKNSIGQIVYSKTPFKIDGCIKETIELNSDLPEGVYILNLIIGEIVENRKLILTK